MIPLHCVLLVASLCQAMHSKPIVALASLQSAALVADGVSSMNFRQRGLYEADPVSRVFIGRYPTWARMAPAGAGLVIGQTWLAYKLKTSRHWERHIWWVPMVLGTAANVYGAAHNANTPGHL